MKRQKGSVTIEASIALTAFMFFILTFLSFGQIYRVQNKVSHAVNMACENISSDAFKMNEFSLGVAGKTVNNLADTINNLVDSINNVAGSNIGKIEKPDLYEASGSAMKEEVKKQFYYFLNDGKETTEEEMKKKYRITSIDFKESGVSKPESTDTKNSANPRYTLTYDIDYTIKPQFAFFAKEITLHKSAKIKLCKYDK